MGTQSTWGSVVNMNPRHMLSATLLLAVAQASSLRPASTVALESFDRLMELSRDERTLYSGFKPPMLQRSYDEDYDVVASTRSLGCPMKWTTRGDFCYRHFSASTGGWTWDQARRECKSEAYSEGQMGADLTFPQNEEDVWLGAKFPVNQLQKKTSTGNPETWGDYNGWSSWKDGITPARGISSERRLLIKGDSSGDWVVWNGNEKKGFVCQYRKKACKTGWFEDTTLNKCLKAFTGEDNKMTWQNAQRKCEEQGLNGNLASLMSEANVLSLLGAQPVPTPATTPEPPSGPLQASPRSGHTATTTTYEAFWLGGSVQYNGGSLNFTWTDGTLKWDGKKTNHVHPDAWAAGYNKPTAWIGEVNTFINHDGKIGLNTGNDKANFICQYDIPLTVQQLLEAGMFSGGRKRKSLF